MSSPFVRSVAFFALFGVGVLIAASSNAAPPINKNAVAPKTTPGVAVAPPVLPVASPVLPVLAYVHKARAVRELGASFGMVTCLDYPELRAKPNATLTVTMEFARGDGEAGSSVFGAVGLSRSYGWGPAGGFVKVMSQAPVVARGSGIIKAWQRLNPGKALPISLTAINDLWCINVNTMIVEQRTPSQGQDQLAAVMADINNVFTTEFDATVRFHVMAVAR